MKPVAVVSFALLASAAAQAGDSHPSSTPPYVLSAALAARLQDIETAGHQRVAQGGEIANQGVASAGVPACISCHGSEGKAPAGSKIPWLGGQPAWYLYKQLIDYASGARTDPAMSAFAKTLGDDDRLAVALYYAAKELPVAIPPSKALSQAQRTRGAVLLEYGDNSKGLQGCLNCHGPNGTGEAPGAPALLHQSPEYVRAQLIAWRSGYRRNDVAGLMQAVTARLDEADIEALTAAITDPPSMNAAHTP